MYTRFFTVEAALAFDSLPPRRKKELTEAAWCRRCKRHVDIGNLEGKMRKGDLVLPGGCVFCFSSITQVVKASELKRPVS